MTLAASHVELGIVDAGCEVVDAVEHERAALVLEQGRVGGGDLHHGAVRAQAAAEHDERASRVERIGGRADHLGIDDLRTGDVLADRPPGDRDRVEVEQLGDLSP